MILREPCQHIRLTYDMVTRHPEQDFDSTLGLLLAIQHVLRVEKTGLLWLGIPCSSFGFMASSQHRRRSYRPLGDVALSWVQQGNRLSARSILLALLALVRGVFYFAEQPGQSTLVYFPYLTYLLGLDILGCAMTRGLTVRWPLAFAIKAVVPA